MSINCYDSDGNILKELYQWDANQSITITGVTTAPIPVLHFCNRKSEVALVVTPTLSGESIVANIPNILLQQAETIICYIYQDSDMNGYRTTHALYIPVIPRPMPDDYEYEDDEEHTSIHVLEARINALTERVDLLGRLPSISESDKDKYLHVNATTGDMEWVALLNASGMDF